MADYREGQFDRAAERLRSLHEEKMVSVRAAAAAVEAMAHHRAGRAAEATDALARARPAVETLRAEYRGRLERPCSWDHWIGPLLLAEAEGVIGGRQAGAKP